MTLRVLVAGQEAAGAQVLRTLARSEHEVVAVLTQDPGVPGGPSSLGPLAESFGMRVLPAQRVGDPEFASEVEGSVDVLLNVHSLYIVADDVLAAPAIGSFNLHPGPLPEYAGLNTVPWAIFNGETQYGVTVHWMVPKIDAGPIAFQERFDVEDDATTLSLSARCARVGADLVTKVLDRAARDPSSIPADPQDLSRRRYYPRGRIPQEGRVDWEAPAEEVLRLARAFDYGPFASPWGRPFTELDGDRLELAGLGRTGVPASEPPGTVRCADDQRMWIAAADEWIAVRRLFVDGEVVEVSAMPALA